MLKKLIAAFFILFAFTSISFAGSAVNFKPGKWEITSEMQMAGGMKMPPNTITQCMTKDDIVPQNAQPGQECVITETKTVGNTVTWTMSCKGQQGDMKGVGKITYDGDTFEGEMVMIMPMANMKITSKMSGHRIGDCQ
ncbi:MAG: DUF3617 domain-containing protein [Deltaproteobacteria bacterium]|nr:DUF3617 domain-containing protein [Deltaproteobacteria bacterium]